MVHRQVRLPEVRQPLAPQRTGHRGALAGKVGRGRRGGVWQPPEGDQEAGQLPIQQLRTVEPVLGHVWGGNTDTWETRDTWIPVQSHVREQTMSGRTVCPGLSVGRLGILGILLQVLWGGRADQESQRAHTRGVWRRVWQERGPTGTSVRGDRVRGRGLLPPDRGEELGGRAAGPDLLHGRLHQDGPGVQREAGLQQDGRPRAAVCLLLYQHQRWHQHLGHWAPAGSVCGRGQEQSGGCLCSWLEVRVDLRQQRGGLGG